MSKYTGINLLDKAKECIDTIGEYVSNIDNSLNVSTAEITDPLTQTTITVVTGVTIDKANLGTKLAELQALYNQLHSEVPD